MADNCFPFSLNAQLQDAKWSIPLEYILEFQEVL